VRPSSRAARLEPHTPLAAANGGAEGVRRQLVGDLDLILLRALRRDPDRRYASAEDLAADLRRLLAGRPVSARPDTLEYRARKYLGRHRLGVAAATAIAALSISFAALTAVQLARVARERDRTREAERLARVEADRAHMAAATAAEVSRLVAGVVQGSDPGASHERTLTPREILDRVAERTESQPGGEPAVQARMLTLLGGIYHGLGALDRSRALFERALEIRRDLPAGSRRELARTLAGLALVAHDQQRYEEAERLLRQALAVRREVSRGRGEEVAEDLNRLALTLEARGRPEEAEPLRRDAMKLRRQAGDLPALGATHRAP
jgi:serine/threonine-protein kinase